jgi:two-component system OmpR family sensor kinase
MSLKLRLSLFATLLMLLTLALISFVSYHYVADAFARQLDAALEDRTAEVIDNYVQSGSLEELDPQQPRAQSVPVYVQIVDHLGTPQYPKRPAGNQLLPIDRALIHQALKGATVAQDIGGDTNSPMHIRYAPLRDPDTKTPIEFVVEVGTPLASTESALALMRLLLVGTTLFSSALIGFGVWFAASRTLAAVDRVTHTASTIELSQSLSERIPEDAVTGDDEMSRLVRTFNNMLDRISVAFDAQRQFVADSSHELRSPLTVIRGNLDLLRRTHDPEERHSIERLIEDEAARMSRLVDNLLFLAQLGEMEQAGAPLDRRPVELDSLLLTVYQQARSMSSRHTILLGDEDAITIDGDRDQLQQLLLNLVDNAIKYTPPGGTIILSLRAEGDDALLEVKDTGIGIPPEDLPHIFDRFYRVDKARSRRIGGAGLGLSIVKGIATSHGGDVEVASAPGEGTTFKVRLPRAAAQVPAPVTVSFASAKTASNVVSSGRGPH